MEILLLIAVVALPIYLLPSIIAFSRRHQSRWVILALNVLTGWSGIAWVACLIWAMQPVHISEAPAGGVGTSAWHAVRAKPERLGSASPFQGFLGELWTIWRRDPGRAVLLARWSWQSLPEELVHQAATLQRQAQAARELGSIDEQVGIQLGTMGIFPGSAGGPSFGMDPDQAIFIVALGTIRAHSGDPPATAEMVQVSEPVLRGQVDPFQALIATAPPSARQALLAAEGFVRTAEAYPFIRLGMIIQAASSLPRERIPALLPELERKPSDKVTGSQEG